MKMADAHVDLGCWELSAINVVKTVLICPLGVFVSIKIMF